MILPAWAAVDEVPSVPDASGAPVAKFYAFDRVGEPGLGDPGDSQFGLLTRMPDSKHWTKTVSIEIKDMTLGDAVKTLLKDTDIKFGIDPKVMPLKVTAMLKNVPLQSALLEILKAAGAIATTREDGVMYITPIQPYSNMAFELQRKIAEMAAELAKERAGKSEDHPSVKALERALEALEKRLGDECDNVPGMAGFPNWYFSTPSGPGKGGRTQIFVIKYINPAELVPLVYALGARQATVVSGGKLVVNGTPEVLTETNDLIAELDTEEALPRPVTVQVFADYTVTDDTGKKEQLNSVTAGTVAEGQPIRLQTFAEPKNDDVAPYLLLDIQLLPEVGTGDKVTLSGTVSMPALAETPEIKMGEMPVAVSVKSGSEMGIAQGAYDISGGRLEFHVTAKVTVGKERLKIRTKTKGGFGGGGGGGSLISPGLGGYRGMGGFGGDSECFDPTQWSAAFDACGQNMAQFSAAMEAAAAQWQRAFDGFGGLVGDTGGYGGQDNDVPDCPSGGGEGGS